MLQQETHAVLMSSKKDLTTSHDNCCSITAHFRTNTQYFYLIRRLTIALTWPRLFSYINLGFISATEFKIVNQNKGSMFIMLWDMKSKLSTVHYISTHSASLIILLDAATTDIFIYGNTQPNFLDILEGKTISYIQINTVISGMQNKAHVSEIWHKVKGHIMISTIWLTCRCNSLSAERPL